MMEEYNNMSLHEKVPSQDDEAVTTDTKQYHKLYPSLPKIDSVFKSEVWMPLGSAGGTRPAAAVPRPGSQLGDTQSETANGDVRLKAQILILEEQRRELLSINEKWAEEYRTMKQYYKKVTQLRRSLQPDLSHSEEELREKGGKKITSCKKVVDNGGARADEATSSGLLKAEREVTELRSKNSTLTRRWQHQHEEIRRLNQALQNALQSRQPLQAGSETLHDAWKHQAEVYKEDFLKERKDREKLHEKYLDLEKKYRKVHSELRALELQVTRPQKPKHTLNCSCTNQRPPKPNK